MHPVLPCLLAIFLFFIGLPTLRGANPESNSINYNTKISPKTIAHGVGHSLKLKTPNRVLQDLDENENLMYFQENSVYSIRPLRFKCINNKHYPDDTIDENNCNQWNTIDR